MAGARVPCCGRSPVSQFLDDRVVNHCDVRFSEPIPDLRREQEVEEVLPVIEQLDCFVHSTLGMQGVYCTADFTPEGPST